MALAALACASVLLMPAVGAAATDYEDSSPKLVFQGTWVTDPVPLGGTLKVADSPAAFNIAFQGTALAWLAYLKSGSDARTVYTVHLYDSGSGFQLSLWSERGERHRSPRERC